ncbi:MAG: sugar ABC transporter ATP-binding protein [Kyrpidia sp.]|nr:sugar ABC transporter ATP-binding protein [Kyrpidia sp.]
MRGIRKSFAGVPVLRDVDLAVTAGEVHALLGENGAGKSTLMKILSGVFLPDSGRTVIHGREMVIDSIRTAEAAGIAMIHQELNVIPDLSVADNLFLGRENMWVRWGILRTARLREAARRELEAVGLNVSPSVPVRHLGVGEKQLVEIAKALSKQANILIMDEPTAALTETETKRLFTMIRSLKERGTAVIYISHRMEELLAICDRVTVMRDGRSVGTFDVRKTDLNTLVRHMVGRPMSDRYPKRQSEPGRCLLRVSNLRTKKLKGVRLEIRAGEVVGLGGLMGAGRTEVARAIMGLDPLEDGNIEVDGRPVVIRHPADALHHGLGFVTEDRKEQGLLLAQTVRENLALPTLGRRQRMGWILRKQENAMARRHMERLRIRAAGIEQPAATLSGGNQQKVVFGKWLETSPKILILDEPTRGVDVGAKAEIYELINELTAQGIGILLISSDLPELLAMSDRILVMYEGSVTGIFHRQEADQEAIMACATGQRRREEGNR